MPMSKFSSLLLCRQRQQQTSRFMQRIQYITQHTKEFTVKRSKVWTLVMTTELATSKLAYFEDFFMNFCFSE